MDTFEIAENIKRICKEKGTTPTVACAESGAGKSMVSNMKKGTRPSIAKMQLLADHLGVTVNELLGEKEMPATVSGSQPDFLVKFQSLPPADQDEIMAMVEYKLAKLTNGT